MFFKASTSHPRSDYFLECEFVCVCVAPVFVGFRVFVFDRLPKYDVGYEPGHQSRTSDATLAETFFSLSLSLLIYVHNIYVYFLFI